MPLEVFRCHLLKTLNWVRGLWQFLGLGADLIESKNVDRLVIWVIKKNPNPLLENAGSARVLGPYANP